MRATDTGRVAGRVVRAQNGQPALAWLGLPYAAPARGPLRFAPPAPPAEWRGVRDASAFAPDVLQPLDPSVTLARSLEGSLHLNVWAPPHGEGHPVLVWFHGGAFRAGSGRLYDGREYAARRGVVVVTVNSRLGPLGYANFGGLFGDERFTPNAGYQDQGAAVRWVARNIAAFGGDPARITVAGESAGAVACALMLRDPDLAPLVSGAALQSGGLNQVSTLDNSLELAQAYARALGVSGATRERLWTLPPAAFVGALHTLERVRARHLNSRPVLDGQVLPATMSALLARPVAPVPLLLGANRDEYSLFVKLPDRVFPRTDRALLRRVLEGQLTPGGASRVLDCYPDTPDGLVALGTDMFFHAGNDAQLAAHPPDVPAFRYRFDWGTPLFGLGAAHGMELLFLWPRPMGLASGVLRGADRGGRTRLAEAMQTAWAAFVRTGSPGWPSWRVDSPQVAQFSAAGMTLSTQGEHDRLDRWGAQLIVMP
ncbi:carboxylesterase family protein [Deinococcus taeanensis]|uniref:carboxylesterase/lipase family protein n=1 Tax=Deinococcus taeanensis TaxID=2737050 RepID=UPI001CDD1751|nr:carboxylesterase family protein [Deinococcus taeanensis]UBV43734.1 carboxylesterase family protein [Deinococcus taeanensis]